jgi:hypothetical protein
MLKKIILVAAALAMLQGVAFAGTIGATYLSITDAAFTALGLSFKPSNNVELMYKNDAATKPQLYNIGSKNTSGDTIYATSNMSTNIYKRKDSDNSTKPGTALSTLTAKLPTNAGESLSWGTDWSPL